MAYGSAPFATGEAPRKGTHSDQHVCVLPLGSAKPTGSPASTTLTTRPSTSAGAALSSRAFTWQDTVGLVRVGHAGSPVVLRRRQRFGVASRGDLEAAWADRPRRTRQRPVRPSLRPYPHDARRGLASRGSALREAVVPGHIGRFQLARDTCHEPLERSGG